MAPDILSQFCTVGERERSDAGRRIRVSLTGRNQGSVQIALRGDQTPESFSLDVDGVRARIDVRGWQVNTVAHATMFEPPAGLAVQEVDREDVLKTFGAALGFALERMQ